MIGKWIRFYIWNATGAALNFANAGCNVNIYGLGFKPVNGIWTPHSSQDTLFSDDGSTNLADGAWMAGSKFENTNNFLQFDCRIIANAVNASAGQILVYWDWTSDPSGADASFPMAANQALMYRDSHPATRLDMAAANPQQRSRSFRIGAANQY